MFDLKLFRKQLEESRNIHECELPPLPEVEEGETYLFISYSRQDYKKVYLDMAELYLMGVRYKYDRELQRNGSLDQSWFDDVRFHYLEDPNCVGVIFYISENLLASSSVLAEIRSIRENHIKYIGVNLTNISIMQNIGMVMNKKGTALEMSDVTMMLDTFNDKITYVMYSQKNHVGDFVERLRKEFDVVEDTTKIKEKMSGLPYDDGINYQEAFKIFGTSVVIKNLENQTGENDWGWGPERELFTTKNPPIPSRINSIVDNPVWGDERRFVSIKDMSTNEVFHNDAIIEPGKKYEIQINYSISGDPAMNQLGIGMATNTRMYVRMSDRISSDVSGGIQAVISSDNLVKKVWDGIQLKTMSRNPIKLTYVTTSAKIYNFGEANGQLLSDIALFGTNGILLGFNKLIGNVPTGMKYSGCVTYHIYTQQPRTWIEQKVTHNGLYKIEETALPGDTLTLRICFINRGSSDVGQVVFIVKLSEGLSLVPNTTYLYNICNPDGVLMPNVLDKNGFKVGTYGPGATAEILYQVRVDNNLKVGVELCSKAFVYYCDGVGGMDSIHSTSVIKVVSDRTKEVLQKTAKVQVTEDKKQPKDGIGTISYKEGIYTGELRDGKPHGHGKWTDDKGFVREGNFVDGKMEGHFVCFDEVGSWNEKYINDKRIFK